MDNVFGRLSGVYSSVAISMFNAEKKEEKKLFFIGVLV